jgi:hypothetical protein
MSSSEITERLKLMYPKFQNGRDVEDCSDDDDNDDKVNDDDHVKRILQVQNCINIQFYWNNTSAISSTVF